MKLLVYSSGYGKTPWHNDKQEITFDLHPKCGGDSEKKMWSPWNKDFAATAKQSGGGTPAANVAELLKAISSQAVDSIEELRILGHANQDYFALGGKVIENDVIFEDPAAIIGDISEFKQVLPQCQALQDRFKADARVILMGCNAGSGKDGILKMVSQAFLRKAYGYKEKIKVNFEWKPTGVAVKDIGKVICHRIGPLSAITLRGRMMYSPGGNLMDEVFGNTSSLMLYKLNAWELEPDAMNNTGDLLACARRKDAGWGATELVWRILSTYFPGHAWVAGTAVEPNLQGLKVTKDGTKMCIVVGPWFALNCTPQTLSKRVAEVKEALTHVAAAREGIVPPK